jgi:hypothetical protein
LLRKEDAEDGLGLEPEFECGRQFGIVRGGRLGVEKDRDVCAMLGYVRRMR